MRERKKVKIYKTTILFIILDLIAAWCFFMMYGPWDKIRNMYVNTAMKTMHHQYFANIFYNQKTIDKIMASNYFISFEEDADTDAIVIDTKEKSKYKDKYEEELYTRENPDDDYKVIDLKVGNSNGYLVAIYKPEKVRLISTKEFNVGGKGERITTMCERYGGSVCINGGGFQDSGYGSDIPTGVVIQDGEITWGADTVDTARDNIIGLTKDGKLISFMGEDGNDREENPWKSPNLSDIQYIEHYGSDDHTFWYSENADGNKIKELTGFTLKGLIYPNISVDDFSDSTKELYNQAKKGKNLVEFVDRLVENDFPKNDIEDFITIEFKDDKKLLLNYLNNKSFDQIFLICRKKMYNSTTHINNLGK